MSRSLIVTANGWVRRMSYLSILDLWIVSCVRCKRYWTVSDPGEVVSCTCQAGGHAGAVSAA